MTEEMQVAYVRAMIVNAEARIAGMIARNEHCKAIGLSQVYSQDDFDAVPTEFSITHNQVIGYFTGR